jgi:hypothetical protein
MNYLDNSGISINSIIKTNHKEASKELTINEWDKIIFLYV